MICFFIRYRLNYLQENYAFVSKGQIISPQRLVDIVHFFTAFSLCVSCNEWIRKIKEAAVLESSDALCYRVSTDDSTVQPLLHHFDILRS